MSKIKKILTSQAYPQTQHPVVEVLAQFIDGELPLEENQKVVEHLAACPDCYDIVQQSLGDLEAEKEAVKERLQPKSRSKVYALAASLVFCLMVASGLWYKVGLQPDQVGVLTASVEVDSELRDMLLEDEELVWSGVKAERFMQLLEQRGVELGASDTVILAGLYDPYAAKGLTKEKEILVIRVEDGVVHIEITGEDGKIKSIQIHKDEDPVEK